MNFIKYNKEDVKKRIVVDNPWWQTNEIADFYRPFRYRAYFDSFHQLVEAKRPKEPSYSWAKTSGENCHAKSINSKID